MSDFYYDLSRGAQGEALVANAFEKMGYKVEDVRYDKKYQAIDVDFIVEDHFIEVKSDWNMGSTRNVVLEMYKANDPSKNGWFKITAASHLAFVDMANKVAYVCRTEELRRLVDYAIHNPWETVDGSDYETNGRNPYEGFGIKKKTLNNYSCLLVNIDFNEQLFTKLYL